MAREERRNQEQRGQLAGRNRQRNRGGMVPSRAVPTSTLDPISTFDLFSLLTPFSTIGNLADEIMQGWRPGIGTRATAGLDAFIPTTDVFERDGKLVVRADLPGVDVDNVRVTMTDNSVIIEGERRDERREGGRFETVYGRFRREIEIPEGIDTDTATATFKNGVLEITSDMPQASENRRQIPIHAEQASAQSVQKASQSEQGSAQSEESANQPEQGEQPEEEAA